ncbi:hypothetical protein E2C01_050696 [Portunus trituberculatus]|uniref:Uncharacterized protein n=1 Tax=Portunus trituberculatus TaxID=210409 RepID=A0A5B7G8Z5_PORTR|nr:hypothetical protein [Portunus trituberculatus]
MRPHTVRVKDSDIDGGERARRFIIPRPVYKGHSYLSSSFDPRTVREVFASFPFRHSRVDFGELGGRVRMIN